MKEISQGSLYYVIPGEVMHDKGLGIEHKILYALISGLCSVYGYCFSGNDWLCAELGLQERMLQRHLKFLEDKGYIRREVIPLPNNPFKKERRIYVNASFKKCLPDVTHDALGDVTHDAVGVSPMTPILSKERVISKIPLSNPPQGGEGAAKPPDCRLTFDKVKLKKEAYEELIRDFGKEVVDKKIEEMNEYSEEKPQKFREYKNHAITLRKWIKKDLEKKSDGSKKESEDLSKAQKDNRALNLDLVNELKLDYPDRCSNLTVFYKTSTLICKDREGRTLFDISMLIDHKEFCRFLESRLKIKLLEVRFPNG